MKLRYLGFDPLNNVKKLEGRLDDWLISAGRLKVYKVKIGRSKLLKMALGLRVVSRKVNGALDGLIHENGQW